MIENASVYGDTPDLAGLLAVRRNSPIRVWVDPVSPATGLFLPYLDIDGHSNGGRPYRFRGTIEVELRVLPDPTDALSDLVACCLQAVRAWAVLRNAGDQLVPMDYDVPWVRNERSAVAGLKTTSYAENVVALDRAHHDGSSEAIFANTAGDLCEGTGSNVFIVVDGALVTPPLDSGCLAGITRELVIEWTDASERRLALDDLRRADEAFLTSSTRDVQPISQVVWPDGEKQTLKIGQLTERARDTFAERAASAVDP
jgi:hypothetical protein